MKWIEGYFRQSLALLGDYQGNLPFSQYLKNFFGKHKKFGSKDRKAIAALCYSRFRLGKSMGNVPEERKLITGIFFNDALPSWSQNLLPEKYRGHAALSLQEKIRIAMGYEASFKPEHIFSFDDFSDTIDRYEFSVSHLVQPDLFIRIRPGKTEEVINGLAQFGIKFNMINDDCIAVRNGVNLEGVLRINRDAVIQDLSSQQISGFFESIPQKQALKVWDCCAGSGGKSILASDFLSVAELYVSDIRESILHNLNIRFKEAGLVRPNIFSADIADDLFDFKSKFDLVICDVPCTGSGTWGRTPENLSYFNEEDKRGYAELQQKIVTNASRAVLAGGWLLYATCSVFKEENEDIVSFIEKTTDLRLIRSSVLKGYDKKADTLFAALFRKD